MEQQNQSQQELYKKETHCESCGRFVGIYTRCPYCQALTQKRLSIRFFKGFALLVSTLGMLLLLFYARHVKPPEVKISELGPLSNFAHVRVRGEVDRSFGLHPQWGSISFILAQEDDQERRTIRISAYSQVAREISDLDKIPGEGDLVEVQGQVRFQQDSPSLLINAAEHIVIKERFVEEALELTPADVDASMRQTLVSVTGSVLNTFRLDAGLRVYLDDGTRDGLMVWIPAEHITEEPEIDDGDLFNVVGRIGTFRGTVQVQVHDPDDYRVVKSVSGSGEAAD